jgi:hypothetical protein
MPKHNCYHRKFDCSWTSPTVEEEIRSHTTGIVAIHDWDSDNGTIPGSSTPKLAWASASELNSCVAKEMTRISRFSCFFWVRLCHTNIKPTSRNQLVYAYIKDYQRVEGKHHCRKLQCHDFFSWTCMKAAHFVSKVEENVYRQFNKINIHLSMYMLTYYFQKEKCLHIRYTEENDRTNMLTNIWR